MPLVFFIAGLVLIVTGINGTTSQAGALLKRDFTGPGNFFQWFFAILVAGSLGFIPTLKPVSYGFLALVFVGILLTSGSGFFDQARKAMQELTSGNALNTSVGGFASIGGGSKGSGTSLLDQLFEGYGDYSDVAIFERDPNAATQI